MSHRQVLGYDFELAHNLRAVSITDSVIPANKAWRTVLNETGGDLIAIFWAGSC